MTRYARIFGPALLVAAALAALFAALAVGGGAAPLSLADPGPLVRYGIPVAKLFFNLSFALTIGTLLLAVFALSFEKPELGRALDVASAAAAVWAVSSVAVGYLNFQSAFNLKPSLGDRYGSALGTFLTEFELGTAYLVVTLIAAALTALCFAVRSRPGVFLLMLLAVASIWPIAEQGHAAGAASHDAAVTGMALHLGGAGIWLGGLLLIALIGPRIGDRLVPVLERFSTVALVCFIVLTVSGVVSAQLRLGWLEELGSPYGLLVLAKVGALGVLGVFGLVQRRWIIERLKKADAASKIRRLFWLLIIAEFAFMGIASGVAAGLARTAPPIPEDLKATGSPAERLTGEPLPNPITPLGYLTEWRIDILWTLLVVFGAFFYLAGVRRLRLRGDVWPVHRTVLWLLGLLVFFYTTNGALNAYEKYLFSVHMLEHMVLTMAVPIFLVLGAPVTLAMRAIRKREDGSRGGREWISAIVHSKPMAVLTHPIVAAVLFSGSLWVFYYSAIFRWAVTEHLGHIWMVLHFSIAGYLFVQALIGIDPVAYRPPYPLRLMLLLATMAFHAFFGLAILTGEGLLLADWYGAMGWDTGISALADQQTGGGIAWSVGEIPTVALAIAVAVMWSRSDDRETRRRDRHADRTGEAELNEYNAMLESLNKRS